MWKQAAATLLTVAALVFLTRSVAAASGDCGHGEADPATDECVCHAGYVGPTCQLRAFAQQTARFSFGGGGSVPRRLRIVFLTRPYGWSRVYGRLEAFAEALGQQEAGAAVVEHASVLRWAGRAATAADLEAARPTHVVVAEYVADPQLAGCLRSLRTAGCLAVGWLQRNDTATALWAGLELDAYFSPSETALRHLQRDGRRVRLLAPPQVGVGEGEGKGGQQVNVTLFADHSTAHAVVAEELKGFGLRVVGRGWGGGGGVGGAKAILPGESVAGWYELSRVCVVADPGAAEDAPALAAFDAAQRGCTCLLMPGSEKLQEATRRALVQTRHPQDLFDLRLIVEGVLNRREETQRLLSATRDAAEKHGFSASSASRELVSSLQTLYTLL